MDVDGIDGGGDDPADKRKKRTMQSIPSTTIYRFVDADDATTWRNALAADRRHYVSAVYLDQDLYSVEVRLFWHSPLVEIPIRAELSGGGQ